MGATPSMTRTTPVAPALLPAQGRQRHGTRQSGPLPHWPPRPHKRGAERTGRPPTPTPPPGTGTPRTRRPTPRRAHNPKPGRGETGPGRPPPKHARRSKGPGQDTRRGTDRRNGPTSAQRRDRARCARHTSQGREGEEADAAGARAHTHTKGTRGIPEGQPDRARGTHRPRGMAYQRARVRDTRTGRPATHSAGYAGRGGGNGGDTTPGTGPGPPKRPRAPRTHGRGTAPAKPVVAHCATPQPLG